MDDARVIKAVLIVLCAVVCFRPSETERPPSRSYGCRSYDLPNGVVWYGGRNRLAKHKCNFRYTLIGHRHASCVRGQWNKPRPICATPTGCEPLVPPQHGFLQPGYGGALIYYKCDPGYSLIGALSVYCDGDVWNGTTPTCIPSAQSPSMSCDFEQEVLCGWSQDTNDDFNWSRNRFSTPSGRGTGPSYDHTFGIGRAGHYMYIEASAPRRINDSARLFSPVFQPGFASSCFTFWYHMFGATIGSLRVYTKMNDEGISVVQPAWTRNGEQGPNWLQGAITIPSFQHNFQVVIEGIRGAGFFGDIAIDDVKLQFGSCQVEATTTTTTTTTTTQPTELPETTGSPTTTVTSQPTIDVTTETTRGELPVSVIVTDSTTPSTTTESITYQTTESIDLFTSTHVSVTDTPISTPSVSDVITPSQLRSIDSSTSSTASTTTKAGLKGNRSTIPSKFSERTKPKKMLPQVSKSPSGSSLLVVIIVVAVLISLIGAAALFIYFKRYRFRKDKLSEDSDMRYLSSNEEIEYVDNYHHYSSLHELTVT